MGLLDSIGEGVQNVGYGALGLLGNVGEAYLAAKAPAMYKHIASNRDYKRDQQARDKWASGMSLLRGREEKNLAPDAFTDEEARVAQQYGHERVYQDKFTPDWVDAAQYMAKAPDASYRTAGAGSVRDQFDPTEASLPWSSIKTDDAGHAYGMNRQSGQWGQLPGSQENPMHVRQRAPLVQIDNRINTAPELENMADKETYKITGKYRGDRLTQFNNVLRANTEVVDSINVTKNKLNKLFGITGDATTGYASLLTKLQIPGMAATDWNEAKDVIVSRLAVDKMAELKSLSATGSSGFGALSQKELEVLQKHEIIKLLDKSEGKFRKARKDEIGWYNRNKLPNMETYSEENPYDSPAKLKPVSELTDAELLEELNR